MPRKPGPRLVDLRSRIAKEPHRAGEFIAQSTWLTPEQRKAERKRWGLSTDEESRPERKIRRRREMEAQDSPAGKASVERVKQAIREGDLGENLYKRFTEDSG